MIKTPKKELLTALEKIRGTSIDIFGDIMLDRYIWGEVERISPEAPVPVVLVKNEEIRLGGAGNVARILANLGLDIKVKLCGIVGNDEFSKLAKKCIVDQGIDDSDIFIDSDRPTTVKTRVFAEKQQALRIDRENTQKISTGIEKKIIAAFNKSLNDNLEKNTDKKHGIIVSDYAKGCITKGLFDSLELHIKNSGLTKPLIVLDPHPSNATIYKSITVAKPNRKEAEKCSGVKLADEDSIIKAAEVLLEKWHADSIIITLGKDGFYFVQSDTLNNSSQTNKGIFRETQAIKVFDVSGAGDTTTAMLTAALSVGIDPMTAGDLANVAAGIVVSEVGTSIVGYKDIVEFIENMHN